MMHHKGRENANADTLSRIPQEELCLTLNKREGNVAEQDVHLGVQSEGTKIQEAEASESLNRIKYEAEQLNYRKLLHQNQK